jgi:MFS superfamily sulfate permease-like transporter
MKTASGKNFNEITLLICLLLLGFYGGTGFFVVMGGNPAITKMSPPTFAEFWQHTDHFMAARMKFFGPLLLIFVITSCVMLYTRYRTSSFLLMAGALLFLFIDLYIIISTNHPLNQLIQSWDLRQLPDNVIEIKQQVVNAFWKRAICMIGSFSFGLLAFWKRT